MGNPTSQATKPANLFSTFFFMCANIRKRPKTIKSCPVFFVFGGVGNLFYEEFIHVGAIN